MSQICCHASLGGIDAPARGDAGVGAEQVDGTEALLGAADELLHVGLDADVGGDGHRPLTDARGDGDRAFPVAVADGDATRPVGREPLGERTSDAAGRTGDDDDLVGQLHGEIVGSRLVTDADASARQTFLAGQVAALSPLDFLVVGVPVAPFDAVQVLREEDGSLAVELSPRDASVPFTPEQVTALARLGLALPSEAGAADADGAAGGHRAAVAPASDAEAAKLVDDVLVEVLGVSPTTPVDVRHGSAREHRLAERKIAEMRTNIEPVLASILGKPAERDADGDYLLDLGHVRVFVAPRALPGRPPPIIRIFAITNAGVELTADLGLFLSRLNFTLMFGRFSIDADNSAIWFDETLLGDHVTPEELRFTVEMVATTANEWDQKLAGMFGGKTATAR